VFLLLSSSFLSFEFLPTEEKESVRIRSTSSVVHINHREVLVLNPTEKNIKNLLFRSSSFKFKAVPLTYFYIKSAVVSETEILKKLWSFFYPATH